MGPASRMFDLQHDSRESNAEGNGVGHPRLHGVTGMGYELL